LTAVNGFEGWEIIQQEIPDLLLSDVMMPFMDGYELCGKIKEDTRTNFMVFSNYNFKFYLI
jgi:YesN/AraC family two-component response regulator